MNESILKALMRLFAIVADVAETDHSENERDIVMDYLDRQYSHEIVQKFIEYFDRQVLYYHPEIGHYEQESASQASRTKDNIQALCNQINEELEQEQRLIALVYLLDFIYRGGSFSKSKLENVQTIALALKFEAVEFQDLKAFTFSDLNKISDKSQLLFIDSNETFDDPLIKHMFHDKLDGRIEVFHLVSSNTYVFRYEGKLDLVLNGHNIKANRSYIWSVGSVIRNKRIGPLYFSRVAGRFIQASVLNNFVFTAEDIEFSYRNSSNGIKRFTLTEDSGRLIGIIGGSGSGKSTLLNVLNGNILPKRGSIQINGFDIHEHKELLKGVIGYVPQDDLLIKELTVFQNLYYNARLCFGNYTEAQIYRVVEQALIDFDLVEARDLNVGDALHTILSGGQRKRLNIALELIREPSILFVDEPTSGLSSADSEKVITLLKRQALKGKLVISNIYQPSSDIFKMLDKLIVMDQGGRIIYYGNPVNAITYFKKASKYADAEESECLTCGNIDADQILRIVESRVVDANGRLTRRRKTSPEEWYKLYLSEIDVKVRQTQRTHDSSVPQSNLNIPSHFKQFLLFLQRDVMAKMRNRQYLFIVSMEAPLLAFILAFFTKNFIYENGIPHYSFGHNANMPAFLFMAVIVALFLGMVISAEEIFKDRKILKREKFLNLSRSGYLFSKISILFSISAIQSLIFVLITHNMLEIKGMVFYQWLILFTASCWANMIGLNISSGLNSVVTIYILVPIFLVPELLFSGVVVEFDKMHNKIASRNTVPVIGDMMTSRWAYEAIMVSQFKENRFERQFYSSEKKISNATYYKSYALPELTNVREECVKFRNNQITDTGKFHHDIQLILNETGKISKDLNLLLPACMNSLTPANYTAKVDSELTNWLGYAERIYINQYNQAVKERDNRYDQLVRKLGDTEKFRKFKDKYYNEQIYSVVTNANEFQDFTIQDDQFIRLKDAIFRDPEFRNGRAHFYAPVKKVMDV